MRENGKDKKNAPDRSRAQSSEKLLGFKNPNHLLLDGSNLNGLGGGGGHLLLLLLLAGNEGGGRKGKNSDGLHNYSVCVNVYCFSQPGTQG